MKKVKITIAGIIAFLILYLGISLFVELPFPEFYKSWQKSYSDSQMKNDPVFQIGNTTMEIANQRDSIQCLLILNEAKIDSLEQVIDSLKHRK